MTSGGWSTLFGRRPTLRTIRGTVRRDRSNTQESWSDTTARPLKLDTALTDICEQIKQAAGTFDSTEDDNVSSLRGADGEHVLTASTSSSDQAILSQ